MFLFVYLQHGDDTSPGLINVGDNHQLPKACATGFGLLQYPLSYLWPTKVFKCRSADRHGTSLR